MPWVDISKDEEETGQFHLNLGNQAFQGTYKDVKNGTLFGILHTNKLYASGPTAVVKGSGDSVSFQQDHSRSRRLLVYLVLSLELTSRDSPSSSYDIICKLSFFINWKANFKLC